MQNEADIFSRSEALLGEFTMQALRAKRVIVFGVGGVGSWAAECLIRTGLSHLTIVDDDRVQASNINRQLPATQATIGMPKVEVLRERLLSIHPEAEIEARCERVNRAWLEEKGLSEYDYIIDAIDSVADKTDLILYASRMPGKKIFCSMGAALRMDPTQVTTGELMRIEGDALAKAVRARMKRTGSKPSRKIRCVYSTESSKPIAVVPKGEIGIKGSLMQVTAVFGCTLAGLVITDIQKNAQA